MIDVQQTISDKSAIKFAHPKQLEAENPSAEKLQQILPEHWFLQALFYFLLSW